MSATATPIYETDAEIVRRYQTIKRDAAEYGAHPGHAAIMAEIEHEFAARGIETPEPWKREASQAKATAAMAAKVHEHAAWTDAHDYFLVA